MLNRALESGMTHSISYSWMFDSWAIVDFNDEFYVDKAKPEKHLPC